MASFPIRVLLVLSFSFAFASTLSDKRDHKLDEIEELLLRLWNEIQHMKGAESGGRHITLTPSERNTTHDHVTIINNNNNNKTETSFETNDNRTDEDNGNRSLTTRLENPTGQTIKVDSHPTVSDSAAQVLDSTTTSSDLKSNGRGGPEVTTGPGQTIHQEGFQSTGPSRSGVTQTEGIHQTTAEEKKNKEDKDKEVKEGKDHEDKEEENELREVQNIRRLIDEGEDLERQLNGVFLQLRSISECRAVGDKCGVREGLSRCCKSLKCSGTWSGTCSFDCVPYGQSCSENFFCCSGYQCMKSIDRNGKNTYICQ